MSLVVVVVVVVGVCEDVWGATSLSDTLTSLRNTDMFLVNL